MEMKCDKLNAYKGDVTIPVYGTIADAEVYLKSEADKVIAELKAQKSQAEDDCVFWKKKYNDCKRELDLLKDTNAFYNGGDE